MKNLKCTLALLAGIFFCVSAFLPQAMAVDNAEGQYPTIDKLKAIPEEVIKYIIPTVIRKKYSNLKLDVTASTITGYDSNVNLNRYDEDGSFFSQNALGIYGKYSILDNLAVRGSYDFTFIKYFKFSDPDLVDNVFDVGIDAGITDNLTASLDYTADLVGFPHDEFSEYTMNVFTAALRHDITNWLYHKIAYEFSNKHYPKWKPRNSRGVIVDQRDREDQRNSITHQVGLFINDRTFVKLENKFYVNDSNELFLDFYDYGAFRTKAALMHMLTNKFYGSTSFAYQYKSYFKRSVSDREEDQRDHLFIYGASLFYDILPSISLGASLDMRDNMSNENGQKYEDYIISGGVYAVF